MSCAAPAVQKDALPPLLRIQRVPTPAWAVAQDQSALAVSQKKLDKIAGLRELQDRHFFDFEGNLQIQRARTAVLASQLDAPKGWGPQHTHVAVSGCVVTANTPLLPQRNATLKLAHLVRLLVLLRRAGAFCIVATCTLRYGASEFGFCIVATCTLLYGASEFGVAAKGAQGGAWCLLMLIPISG